jgi:phosphoribosyl 1,2-cyclic phosphate phosphodiesterase
MRVVVLGCGGSAGVPSVGGADGYGDWGACDPREPRNRRTRSSIVIQSGTGERLLVDTAPDLRTQLLACGVPRIDAILYTHAHADHISGLDDVRILNRIIDRPIDAFGTRTTLDEIAHRFEYAFRPWRPPGFFRPVMVPRPVVPGDIVSIAGMDVQVFDQDHKVIRTLGLRIGGFAYSTDVVAFSEASFATLEGVDTWMIGCFQRQPHVTHAHVDLVLEWARRLKVRRTILTHMGPDLDWAWLQRKLPEGFEAAYDGMVIEVG